MGKIRSLIGPVGSKHNVFVPMRVMLRTKSVLVDGPQYAVVMSHYRNHVDENDKGNFPEDVVICIKRRYYYKGCWYVHIAEWKSAVVSVDRVGYMFGFIFEREETKKERCNAE